MKFTIASIFLATSTFASPINVERSSYIRVSDFWARASVVGASMHFIVTDLNYPADTPTDCNLIWTYGSSLKQNARCNNSQYYIRFPDGAVDFNSFTLELERVSGPIPEKGEAKLKSKTSWACAENPEEGVKLACNYDGVLSMSV